MFRWFGRIFSIPHNLSEKESQPHRRESFFIWDVCFLLTVIGFQVAISEFSGTSIEFAIIILSLFTPYFFGLIAAGFFANTWSLGSKYDLYLTVLAGVLGFIFSLPLTYWATLFLGVSLSVSFSWMSTIIIRNILICLYASHKREKKIKTLLFGHHPHLQELVATLRKDNYQFICVYDPVSGYRHRKKKNLTFYGKKSSLIDIVSRNQIRQIFISQENKKKHKNGLKSDHFSQLHRLRRLLGNEINVEEIEYDSRGIQKINLEQRLRGLRIDRFSQAEVFFKDKNLLITGAGGSIGRELCHQFSKQNPASLTLVDYNETALFETSRFLDSIIYQNNFQINAVIKDIRDRNSMENILRQNSIDIIIHCAAYKHVPLMEIQPEQAVLNNIYGTQVIADLAKKIGMEKFIFVSTDKAVNPVSIMGASKRIAELYVHSLGETSDTAFISVRFGNVLNSNGSVVPIFREQIARGGPVTVTHPDMVRYFINLYEAGNLLVKATTIGKNGDVYILDMGEPIRILELAKEMIILEGYVPYQEIDIEFTGLRPGEKLFEELTNADETLSFTADEKIMLTQVRSIPLKSLQKKITELNVAARDENKGAIREIFALLLPEYRPATPNKSSHDIHAGYQTSWSDIIRDR